MFAPCVTARRGPMVRDGCAQRALDGCAEVRMRRSMVWRARRCREVATCRTRPIRQACRTRRPSRYAQRHGRMPVTATPCSMLWAGCWRVMPFTAPSCRMLVAGWRRVGRAARMPGTPPYVLRQHPRTPLASSARVFPPSAHSPLVIPRPAGTCGASCTRPYAPFRDRSDSTIRKVVSAYHRMGACLHFSLMREGLPRPA